MTTLTKEITFDSAHQLLNHDGLCANIHGHTYKLEIGIVGEPIDRPMSCKEGMIVDFTDLKYILEEVVKSSYDHAFIAKGDEPILASIIELGYKHVIINARPTCENMAPIIYNDLQASIEEKFGNEFKMSYVKLWETPTSFCTYSE